MVDRESETRFSGRNESWFAIFGEVQFGKITVCICHGEKKAEISRGAQ